MARISDFPITYRYLDVCVKFGGAGNCSECWKCRQTMMTLDLLGKLDRYSSVFDLSAYRRDDRARLMGQMLSSRTPQFKEIAEEASKNNPRFPAAARIWALLYLTRSAPTRGLKRILPERLWNALKRAVRRWRGCPS